MDIRQFLNDLDQYWRALLAASQKNPEPSAPPASPTDEKENEKLEKMEATQEKVERIEHDTWHNIHFGD